MYKRKDITIFNKGRVSEIFDRNIESIEKEINSASEDYILNVNESEYVSFIENKYILDSPQILFDEAYIDSFEDDVPIEYSDRFMNGFPYQERSWKAQIIQYILPCSGDTLLLKYRPANTITFGGGGHFEVKEHSLVSELISTNKSTEQIKAHFENEARSLGTNYQALINDIKKFNSSLRGNINSKYNARKQSFLTKNNMMESIGIPIKKRANVSSTFSIPKPALREKIVMRPEVTDKGFKAEPMMDDSTYQKVLKLINDVGKNFERMPSVYKDKDEESLRDHILMTLDPNFQLGSAAGETFNKTGKTDILLRYDSSVAFIAECKFWTGEKGFLSTITQLLSYLTWRDTKAAVIIFVKQKDITSVIEKAKENISKHENYLSFISATDINWFNYRFHLNGDKNREVKIAVQIFHLPR